ncbi:hypothetical protein AX15_002492 [Amanita polypyramis BW_CC]|nr:hypothetical protein AX15_002492 [Amanita polypyramis BW_CC]
MNTIIIHANNRVTRTPMHDMTAALIAPVSPWYRKPAPWWSNGFEEVGLQPIVEADEIAEEEDDAEGGVCAVAAKQFRPEPLNDDEIRAKVEAEFANIGVDISFGEISQGYDEEGEYTVDEADISEASAIEDTTFDDDLPGTEQNDKLNSFESLNLVDEVLFNDEHDDDADTLVDIDVVDDDVTFAMEMKIIDDEWDYKAMLNVVIVEFGTEVGEAYECEQVPEFKCSEEDDNDSSNSSFDDDSDASFNIDTQNEEDMSGGFVVQGYGRVGERKEERDLVHDVANKTAYEEPTTLQESSRDTRNIGAELWQSSVSKIPGGNVALRSGGRMDRVTGVGIRIPWQGMFIQLPDDLAVRVAGSDGNATGCFSCRARRRLWLSPCSFHGWRRNAVDNSFRLLVDSCDGGSREPHKNDLGYTGDKEMALSLAVALGLVSPGYRRLAVLRGSTSLALGVLVALLALSVSLSIPGSFGALALALAMINR